MNTSDPDSHLDAARLSSQAAARRRRQVAEIAALVVGGARERAEGLALVHAAEFPDDADLLARMTGDQSGRTVTTADQAAAAPDVSASGRRAG